MASENTRKRNSRTPKSKRSGRDGKPSGAKASKAGKPSSNKPARPAKRGRAAPGDQAHGKPNRKGPAPARSSQSSGQSSGQQYGSGPAEDLKGKLWIYGRHALVAALKNPNRTFHQLIVTRSAAEWLVDQGLEEPLVKHRAIEALPEDFAARLPENSVHQGALALCEPLPEPELESVIETQSGPLLVLDQITDPQNIGNLFRSAAAFGVCAIISQDRRTPPLSGVLAKAAAGAVDIVPHIPVVNIARTLTTLREANIMTVGLAGGANGSLDVFQSGGRFAIVLGAEGKGLRPLVAKGCDQLVTIPMMADMESLNVATAGAIALHAAFTNQE